MLARADEPELTTGEIFDRGRIAAQPFRLFAEHFVFGARASNRLLEHFELLTLLHRFEQPFFSHQRVDEDDQADEQQGVLDGPSAAATSG